MGNYLLSLGVRQNVILGIKIKGTGFLVKEGLLRELLLGSIDFED